MPRLLPIFLAIYTGFISPAVLSLILYSHRPAKLGIAGGRHYCTFPEMNSDTKHQMEIMLALPNEQENQA